MPEESATNAGVGIIYPPPDIRGVIDKTAQFVAKCGPEFEQRVLREQNHTKFAFLLPTNPYRPYYEHKVKEFKTGVVEETKPEVPQAIIDAKAKDEEKKKRKEQLKALTMGEKKRKVVKPPAPDQFVVNHPYIAPMDMDIIKLTAQFVARNGQKFLIGLTQRESRNPQFDFLKPTHALFGYFTSLVDAYTKCLMPNKDEVEKLKKCSVSESEILDRAMARYSWDEQEESQRRSKEEEDKEEKEQSMQIDWHEFVVVETIEFTAEDENIPLAAPIDVSTGAPAGAPVPLSGNASEGVGTVFQEAHIEKPKGVEEEVQQEPAVDLEKEEREKQEKEKERERMEKEREEREREEREREERERLEREQQEAAEQEDAVNEEELMELDPEIPMPAPDMEMKVRKGYVRHKKNTAQRMMQRCPITGQLIPAEEMSNHLKVLLLDPKWKHQKDALVERARKESAFADDVEANLAGFVAKRPDLFGSVDEQIREAAEAGAEAAARDAGADAGPAHTMVPPTAAAALASGAAGAKPAPALSASAAGVPGGLPAALTAGPTLGMSSVNSRLPSAALLPPSTPSVSQVYAGMGDEDEDEDDPTAKKPSPEALFPEQKWVEKYPNPIQLLVQVSLGADAVAANIPSAIPLELLVKMKVQDMKQLLIPKVVGAGVNMSTMKLKVQSTGYILKNVNSLAYYNVAPGSVIELTKKVRGGR
mmetsp:Transcript_99037/g.171640  ORF Transcript_99037/g.171640 Transcript_99037/m.171640 type:complete len:705 (-) Transcript_99037:105-2219(-)